MNILNLTSIYTAASPHFSSGRSEPQVCQKYICGQMPLNYCMGVGKENIYVADCPNETYCSTEGMCVSIKEKYIDHHAYPGEICDVDAHCKAGKCFEGFCRGKSAGEKCQEHSECAQGLRCHHTCKELFKHKERGCLSDFDCTADSGCNYGECTHYLSLDSGEKVEKCEDHSNLLCSTSMCADKACINTQHLDEYPKECNSDADCVSSQGFYSKCTCGRNDQGKSYCLPFPGDSIGKEFFGLLSKWLKSKSIKNCNTRRRFSLNCMRSYWNACHTMEFLYRSYRYNYFPLIIENAPCVENSITRDYWGIRSVYQSGIKTSKCEFSFKI